MFDKKDKRFVLVSEQGVGLNSIQVIADRRTGAHYVLATGMSGGVSITPLLNEDGKPLIDKNNLNQYD